MSQLNFFITETELFEKLTEAQSQCNISIFGGRFFERIHPEPVPDIAAATALQNLIIWSNSNFGIPTCSRKGLGKNEGLYLFDYHFDPIIEITVCAINDKLLSPGRIFYKNGWIKHPDLDQLHTSVCRKIRRIFAKELCDLSPPFKFSKNVKNMMSNGFRVELGVGGMQLPKS